MVKYMGTCVDNPRGFGELNQLDSNRFFVGLAQPEMIRITGRWYTYPSEKSESVSWDDDIPNIWKVIKFHVSPPARPLTTTSINLY